MEISVRQNLVNDFADYLCNLISENNAHKTKLSVVDVENFMVIKGYTKSSEVIDFNKVTIEFIELVKDKYPDHLIYPEIQLENISI